MCGVCGFTGPPGAPSLAGWAGGVLSAMASLLSHRGPDGEGVFLDPSAPVALAHRRLAVIDLEGGAQPMFNEDRTVAVVFNGEIYNHAELREELVAAGHVFASDHSDTEVLVHGHEAWGQGLAARLNGMFGFAAYDRRTGTLVLARDRFGEKPVYVAHLVGGGIAFSSELTALLAHPACPSEVDPWQVRRYFGYGFVPSPGTLYRGIEKLEPGTVLRYDVRSGRVSRERFWSLAIEPDEGLVNGEEDAAERLRALLDTATSRRLISDVPLGVFLSGGVDSSAVTASAARARPGVRTFTIGFDEASFDESEHAAEVATHLGTQHAARRLVFDEAAGMLSRVLSAYDDPIADSSVLPTYLLSGFAREGVTVALTGDAGDELFAGYDPFAALGGARLARAVLPGPALAAAAALAGRVRAGETNMSLWFRAQRFLSGVAFDPALWHPVWMAPMPPALAPRFFGPGPGADAVYADAAALWAATPGGDVERSLAYYTRFYLGDQLLTKVDRAAMAHGLETRAVMLDNDLVDFARRLPTRYKIGRGERKRVLKRAVTPRLPPAIPLRKKKGFGSPITRWLKHIEPPADDAGAAGFDPGAVRGVWEEHRAGRADHRLLLWAWMCLHATLTRQREVIRARSAWRGPAEVSTTSAAFPATARTG